MQLQPTHSAGSPASRLSALAIMEPGGHVPDAPGRLPGGHRYHVSVGAVLAQVQVRAPGGGAGRRGHPGIAGRGAGAGLSMSCLARRIAGPRALATSRSARSRSSSSCRAFEDRVWGGSLVLVVIAALLVGTCTPASARPRSDPPLSSADRPCAVESSGAHDPRARNDGREEALARSIDNGAI